jgi:predicted Zn-dependent protease
MDLSALADLGDFLSGIAVIVSLIYLAAQIRQNTRTLRAASFQALSDSLSDRTFRIAESSELQDLFDRGLRGEELSEQEASRFQRLMASLMRVASSSFVQYRAGLLTEDQWQAFRVMPLAFLASRGGRDWWRAWRRVFDSDFAAYVDSEVRKRDERAAQQGAAADDPQRVPIDP